MKRKFWYAVHNCIAHPLLITGLAWADAFHDWTAERLEPQPKQERLSFNEARMRFYGQMGGVWLFVALYFSITGDTDKAGYIGMCSFFCIVLMEIQSLKK